MIPAGITMPPALPCVEMPVIALTADSRSLRRARCRSSIGQSTVSDEQAMRRAAAKALNASGFFAEGHRAQEGDITLDGTGRSRIARFILGGEGKAVRA